MPCIARILPVLVCLSLVAANWPQFRGPTMNAAAYARLFVNDATSNASVVVYNASAKPDARNRVVSSQLSLK